ncbi:MAG: AsmA family protein [Deltaproteobacteria bacterium]|nr:AsmA family protein [Deltaproteobacteria bacterium]
MNRTIKWVLIIGGGLMVVVVAALVLIPRFIDVKRYKPQIEAKVSKATGRTFTLGDDLRLSLFPWAGVTFSDLHLGSLPGFEEKDFVVVKSFDVRVKLFPLLFKDIQVKRFILNGARVVLETRKDGRVNWEFKAKSEPGVSKKVPLEVKKSSEDMTGTGLVLKGLTVGEFAVTDGSVVWLDHGKKTRKEISDVSLRLQDVSMDRPVRLTFSARLDNQLFSIQGSVGPTGKALGKGTIPLDLTANILGQMDVGLKGNVVDPAVRPKFDVDVQISPFSPRKLLGAMGKVFPVATSDPKALNLMALKAGIKGDAGMISVSNGVIDLDESKLNISMEAGNFSKPSVTFKCDLDKIDLDRYLPPPSQEKGMEKQPKTAAKQGKRAEKQPKTAAAQVKKKTDYSLLRKLSIDGTVKIGNLKVKNAKIENVHFKLIGKNGVFNLRSMTMALYQGDLSGHGRFSVQKNVPRTNVQLTLKGVQAGPLFTDVLKKDFLEGNLKANINLTMTGDDAKQIKKTLNGNGDLLFKDGAIKGIDLAGMANNVKAAFGLAEKTEETGRTEFSELHAPFTVKQGLVNTANTTLISPLIRLTASGTADLVSENLDFRVEPKFVGTLKGQGDTQERSGLMVPVLVTGTFSSPKFRPDLESILKQKIERSLPDLQKQLLPGDGQKGEPQDIGEQIKGLLKGFGN